MCVAFKIEQSRGSLSTWTKDRIVRLDSRGCEMQSSTCFKTKTRGTVKQVGARSCPFKASVIQYDQSNDEVLKGGKLKCFFILPTHRSRFFSIVALGVTLIPSIKHSLLRQKGIGRDLLDPVISSLV